ncbi:heme-binding protein 2-like [Hyperolius riggenbachi]|uniref:heme-binding protein 2-like n=1 Tax=Hyperolius riggenbachi TaxID=752182 RepID=UPI0035A3CFE5
MEGKIQLFLSLLVIFGITAAAEQESDGVDWDQKPPFCGKLDCPKYEVIKQYDDFELRLYEETTMATTPLTMDMFGFGLVKSFRRLFNYIDGKNSEGQKINMTVPVVIHAPLAPEDGNATMSFYLPPVLENPPIPSDENVKVEKAPKVSYYVRSFGGYALYFTYIKHAKALAEDLRANGLAFDDSYYHRVGYNDPFTFVDRHNEVWYVAK